MNHGVQYYHVMSSVTSKFIAAKFTDKFFDLLVLFDRINHSFLLGRLLPVVLLLSWFTFTPFQSPLLFFSFFHNLIILVPRMSYSPL